MTIADSRREVDRDAHRVVIQPLRGWQLIDLREMWRYRGLLVLLTWRDIKIRYKQTVLGASWTVLQPVMFMVVYTLVFGHAMNLKERMPADIPYPIFVFAGLLPWNLFAGALAGSSISLLTNRQLVTKVYLPRLMIPVAATGVNVVNFFISLAVLFVLMVGWGIAPGPQLLLLPFLLVMLLLAALAVGVGLAALTVYYRDVRQLVPHLVQAWMFLSPVIWPVEIVPGQYQWMLPLNPMTGYLVAFRYSLCGTPMDWGQLAVSVAMTLGLLLVSMFYFRRVETRFADII